MLVYGCVRSSRQVLATVDRDVGHESEGHIIPAIGVSDDPTTSRSAIADVLSHPGSLTGRLLPAGSKWDLCRFHYCRKWRKVQVDKAHRLRNRPLRPRARKRTYRPLYYDQDDIKVNCSISKNVEECIIQSKIRAPTDVGEIVENDDMVRTSNSGPTRSPFLLDTDSALLQP